MPVDFWKVTSFSGILDSLILATGIINVRHQFGRAPIPVEKQVLGYLGMLANGNEKAGQVADRCAIKLSSCRRVLGRVNFLFCLFTNAM